MKRTAVAAGLLLLGLLHVRPAAAQFDDDLIPPDRSWVTPERFVLELRAGPYHPNSDKLGNFKSFYGGDKGPLLALELDVIAYRLEDVLYISGGGGIGTANFSGKTLNQDGSRSSEDASFSYLPLQLLATVRFDALARKLSVPFILTAKLGYQWAYWTTNSGGSEDANGWSVGLLWAGQVALDLDTFDRQAARTMDEEWGINHSFLFFEIFGFEPSSKSLPIGSTAWSAGLGFVF